MGTEGAEDVVYPSIAFQPQTGQSGRLSPGLGGVVGDVKKSRSDLDGLTAANVLLLRLKAAGQTRHSLSTSLMRTELIKMGPKPLNGPSASLVRVILS